MKIFGLGKYGLELNHEYDVHPDMAKDLVEAGKAVYEIKEKSEIEPTKEKKEVKQPSKNKK